MYVVDANGQCKLMEGGMASGRHAANVPRRSAMHARPALLEWLDGSTFKMRVSRSKARQEKRILLKLHAEAAGAIVASLAIDSPADPHAVVRDWSFNARVKNGTALNVWSPSHAT